MHTTHCRGVTFSCKFSSYSCCFPWCFFFRLFDLYSDIMQTETKNRNSFCSSRVTVHLPKSYPLWTQGYFLGSDQVAKLQSFLKMKISHCYQDHQFLFQPTTLLNFKYGLKLIPTLRMELKCFAEFED